MAVRKETLHVRGHSEIGVAGGRIHYTSTSFTTDSVHECRWTGTVPVRDSRTKPRSYAVGTTSLMVTERGVVAHPDAGSFVSLES